MGNYHVSSKILILNQSNSITTYYRDHINDVRRIVTKFHSLLKEDNDFLDILSKTTSMIKADTFL